MVVYEVKDTNPIHQRTKKRGKRREVNPIEPINRVKPIDFIDISREWGEKGGKRDEVGENITPDGSVQSAHTIISLINDQLTMVGISVHLALAEKDGGYSLNVHDCVDGDACNIVAEEPLDLNELPELLQRLKQQSGILLDKQL
jgi:hypothetical protein